MNPLGAAGHIAGRAAETVARETVYAQRRQAVTARAQEMAGQLHAQVATRPQTALVQSREIIAGDTVLKYNYTFLKRFACWGTDHEVVTAALWAAATHARHKDGTPVWQYCPRLGIFGPSGSGKSWKARLIGKLAYRPEILIEPTKPAFIDLCADKHTIILTEADEAFRSPGRSRGILAVVNGSYQPDVSASKVRGGVALRSPLYTFVVLDGIDTLLSANRPDLHAMISRCIILKARKAPAGYRPPRFDGQARLIAERLGTLGSAWMGQEVEDGIAEDYPRIPEHVGNRPFALWEPLFAVAWRADAAWREEQGEPEGEGPWSAACRAACEQLEAVSPDQDDDGMSELDRQMAEWLGE